MAASPTTASQAARAIARWLQQHPETMPDTPITVGVQPGMHGAIVIHDRKGSVDYIGYEADAGVAFEGGPYQWPVMALSDAVYRGQLDLGDFWHEAANGWSVLIYAK